MASVGVVWSGKCLLPQQQELVRFLGRLADVNDELLKADPPPANEFTFGGFHPDFMTPERNERLRLRPNVDRIDRIIHEPIEVDSSIFSNYEEFRDGAEQLGLPIVGETGSVAEDGPFVVNFSSQAPAERCISRRLRSTASISKCLASAIPGIRAKTASVLFSFTVRKFFFSTAAL
jgi:hypothetical protein